jgi:hypothetical protein
MLEGSDDDVVIKTPVSWSLVATPQLAGAQNDTHTRRFTC